MKRSLTVLAVATAMIASTSAAAAAGDPARTTTRTYQASDANIANPERGFYHHTETHFYADGTGYVPLKVDTLRSWRANEHITLITRMFYLEKFSAQDRIDFTYLRNMQADFNALRAAGMKARIRFAYALPKDAWPYTPPYGDAPLDRVLKQIHQLTPILRLNSDVISVVETGFVGLWGEWYYTDNFVEDPANPGVITDADMAKRRQVVEALLRALPKDRMIELRTPNYKQRVFGLSTGTEGALTADQAYSGSDVARVGQHNDCFLASPDDFGTFISNPISLDEDFVAQDTKYLPSGGEVCTVNPPKSEWPSASALMAKFHYTSLNIDYNKAVHATWGDNLETVKKDLGYRFVLTQGTYSDGARPGAQFGVDLSVRNDGWASPFNPRGVQLILQGNGRTYAATLKADPRWWAPGTTSRVTAQICAPTIPGSYHMYLNLPDPKLLLHSQLHMPGTDESFNSAYAIQLANQGTWQAATGYNDLGQELTVGSGQQSSARCADGAVELHRIW